MEIKEFVLKLFAEGKKIGFTDMEIYYIESEDFEVTAFEKSVNTYKINTDIGLSFRGIRNNQMGYAYTEKYEEEDIEFLIKNAAQNAAVTENDIEVSIFDGSDEYKIIENNELKDVPISKKIKDALDLEEQALKYDTRIKSARYCLISTGQGIRRIINTKGLELVEKSGYAVAYLSLIAEDKGLVKSGNKFMMNVDYNKIDFSSIIEEASRKAISKIGASSVESGKYKIILKNEAAADLLSTFSSVFSSDAVQKGLSLLKNKVGTKIASEAVNMIDDPFKQDAPMKVSFDDEGVATYNKDIIRAGILKTLLYNNKTAKKEGLVSTGNGFKASYKSPVGVSPTNMYISPGKRNFEEAVKSLECGIIITALEGLHAGANPVSGDFSLAAEGFLVEKGTIIRPVEQIIVADNFYKVMLNIEETLSDFEFNLPSSGSIGSPSLIIKEMIISGEGEKVYV